MLTDERLNKIRARLMGATARPWEMADSRNPEDPFPYVRQKGMGEVVAGDVFEHHDAVFIAHAPQDIADLLAEVECSRLTPNEVAFDPDRQEERLRIARSLIAECNGDEHRVALRIASTYQACDYAQAAYSLNTRDLVACVQEVLNLLARDDWQSTEMGGKWAMWIRRAKATLSRRPANMTLPAVGLTTEEVKTL